MRVAKLRYYWFLETALDGIPLVVTRTGWTGEVGYEVYLRDGSRGDELWERIMEAGKPQQHPPDRPLRHPPRRGRHPQLGRRHDAREQRLRSRTRAGWWTKARPRDYIGRDALERIKAGGVTRKLAGIEIEGPRLEMNAVAWPVAAGSETVGRVTSAV